MATAAQRGSRQTRLATRVNTLPRRVDLYFAGNFFRQAVWAVIAFSTGYYSANTVSLSFGALAINDVVAAAITVAFCEVRHGKIPFSTSEAFCLRGKLMSAWWPGLLPDILLCTQSDVEAGAPELI